MSAIFDNSNSITLGHKLSLVQTNSHSGKRSAQRRGPYLYTFEAEVNDMLTSSESYQNINSELRTANYGVNTVVTGIPGSYCSSIGTWLGSPLVKGASQAGNSVLIDGFISSKTGVISDGDYMQFGGDNKVYQAVGDYDSNSSGDAVLKGTTTQGVKINTPLVKSPSDNAVITNGINVQFNLALTEYSDATIIPRDSSTTIASWSSFMFEEVI